MTPVKARNYAKSRPTVSIAYTAVQVGACNMEDFHTLKQTVINMKC